MEKTETMERWQQWFAALISAIICIMVFAFTAHAEDASSCYAWNGEEFAKARAAQREPMYKDCTMLTRRVASTRETTHPTPSYPAPASYESGKSWIPINKPAPGVSAERLEEDFEGEPPDESGWMMVHRTMDDLPPDAPVGVLRNDGQLIPLEEFEKEKTGVSGASVGTNQEAMKAWDPALAPKEETSAPKMIDCAKAEFESEPSCAAFRTKLLRGG